MDQARSAYEAGDLAQAARTYEAILVEAPGRVEALLSLGLVASALGDRDRARRCYLALLDDPEERSDALFNLALLEKADGRLGEAAKRLAAVVEERPDYPAARLALAEVLVAAGRGDEAGPHFAIAGELVPDDPYPLVARARLAAAKGDRKAALELLDKAALADPESGAALEEKAGLLEAGGEDGEAKKARLLALDRARSEPGPDGFFHRAELAIAIGDLDRARSELRGCLGLDPAHRRGLELGGRLLGREGLRAVTQARQEEALFSNPAGAPLEGGGP